jgi:heat shock protein HslJ
MIPIRSEDDVRALFAEESRDVGVTEDLLARLVPSTHVERRRRQRRQRWIAAGVGVAVVLAVATVLTLVRQRGHVTGAVASPGGPPLVGTEWQLASYQGPTSATPVTVTTDSTLEFSRAGGYSAHACNYIGGRAKIGEHTITFTPTASTGIGCSNADGALDRQVETIANGTVSWSISGSSLALSKPGGYVLKYRVRPSIYPNLRARTIVTGDRDGGQFRLAVDGPTKDNDRLYLVFEERTAPGQPWGQSSIAAPGQKDCLADGVMGAGRLGGETFVAAWATPEVATVTSQAVAGAPSTQLTLYHVPGSSLRIAGVWTSTFQASGSPVTFFDKNHNVIAAYPHGPC